MTGIETWDERIISLIQIEVPMTEIITQPGCAKCKKIKQWFREHEIPFTETSLYAMVLEPERMKKLSEEHPEASFSIFDQKPSSARTTEKAIAKMQRNPSGLYRPVVVLSHCRPGQEREVEEYLSRESLTEACSGCSIRSLCHEVRLKTGKDIVPVLHPERKTEETEKSS